MPYSKELVSDIQKPVVELQQQRQQLKLIEQQLKLIKHELTSELIATKLVIV